MVRHVGQFCSIEKNLDARPHLQARLSTVCILYRKIWHNVGLQRGVRQYGLEGGHGKGASR